MFNMGFTVQVHLYADFFLSTHIGKVFGDLLQLLEFEKALSFL